MNPCPYVGLRAFNRDEAHLFFGREEHTDALLDALARQQFLAVIGLSGSGKSSLVKCGLVPALEAGYLSHAGTHWQITEFRPGNDPFKNLADSLAQVFGSSSDLQHTLLTGGAFALHEQLAAHPLPQQAKLLLVCDQFEELFRYSSSHQVAAAFVALLLASSQTHTLADGRISAGIYLVLTMRSDFLGDCAQFIGLAEAINQGLYLTPRLNREQLRLAIEEPALVADGAVEPALVVRLLEDVGNDPDQLPLLQHALMRLWDTQQRPALAQYQALGGLKQSLNQHADLALGELDTAQQRLAEIVFRALTERSRDGKDTRRPVAVRELLALTQTDLASLSVIIDTFRQAGRNFLMPPPNIALTEATILDISHESLIRQWERLQGWVADEAESAAMYLRLLDAAQYRREAWRGTDLTLALAWQQASQPNAQWAARYAQQNTAFTAALDFLQQSQVVEQQRLASATRQRKAKMRALLAALCVAMGLSGWAVWERSKADTARVELTGFTLHNLIANTQNIGSFMQGVNELGQQSVLLTYVEQQLAQARNLSPDDRQIWRGQLTTLSPTQLMSLIRLLDNPKTPASTFAILAKEIRIPLPTVSAELPTMLTIPAGSFVMGCQDGRDTDCNDDEKPAHSVTLPAFQLSQYEITQGQWQAIMGDNPSFFQKCGADCPVEAVSWNDIQTFIQKLNQQTGKHYRLPSEAEWEYACRGGQSHAYCGSNEVHGVAWFDGNADRQTQRVGSKQPNGFGLHDMSGNVWEWLQDQPHNTYDGAPTDGSAWTTGGDNAKRVLRGGSWDINPQYVRAAGRNDSFATYRVNVIGFRLARTLP